MYKVLLTDDEQIMIDSLNFIINKNFADKVQTFSSLSGTGALEIFAKNDIDIVFMDINMPGLNGLETLKYIIQSKPEVVIIILSAFDQFQYAQEAVNLGVYKYLTKPVNRNLVIETLQGAMNLVEKRRGYLSTEKELHKQLDFVSPMVESDFIYSSAFSDSKDVSDYFSYFGIENSVWAFCCMEIPRLETKNQYDVYATIRQEATAKCNCILGSFMMNRIVLFVYFPQKVDGDFSDYKETISSLYKLITMKLGSGIRLGVSNFESEVTNTNRTYNKALEMLNLIPQEGGVKFADEAVEKENEASTSGEGLEEIKTRLFGRIRIGDVSAIRQILNLYFEKATGKLGGQVVSLAGGAGSASGDLVTSSSNLDKLKNSLFELLVNVRNLTVEVVPGYENENFANLFSYFAGENSLENLKKFVIMRCEECASAIMQKSSQSENPIIEAAVKYIEKNISKNISLYDLAAQVNVSSFYLSKLFKEVKNQNFVAFLTDLRMEKARELLKNPLASIKEVSSQVGYNDQNYFSRAFRNKFGITPTEFRDVSRI